MNVLCRNLLLGVTGSISALSVPAYVAFLKRGLVGRIRVIQTKSAIEIIPPATIQAYTGEPVFTDTFAMTSDYYVPHIQLTREADIFLVMPTSANMIAKIANGIADDLLSTSILASPQPVVIVPCMNGNMWFNQALQDNVAAARKRGHIVIEPVRGIEIADSEPTFGVMPPLEAIIGVLADTLKQRRSATPQVEQFSLDAE